MVNRNNSSLKLLSEVTQTIEVFGEEGAINILAQARKNNIVSQHLDFVIEMVSTRFKLSASTITSGKSTNKNIKNLNAIKLVCYYGFYLGSKGRNIKVTQTEIGKKINKHQTLVSKYIIEMEERKTDKSDVVFQAHFKEFDLQIKKHTSKK